MAWVVAPATNPLRTRAPAGDVNLGCSGLPPSGRDRQHALISHPWKYTDHQQNEEQSHGANPNDDHCPGSGSGPGWLPLSTLICRPRCRSPSAVSGEVDCRSPERRTAVEGGDHQPTDHGPAQRSVLLAPFTKAQDSWEACPGAWPGRHDDGGAASARPKRRRTRVVPAELG